MDITLLFKTILNLSLMGSVVIGIILLVKLIFKDKLNPHWHYYIWFLVILRLIIPYTPESSMSIFNLFPQVPQEIDSIQDISNTANVYDDGVTNSIIPDTNEIIQVHDPQPFHIDQENGAFKLNYEILGIIWIIGVVTLMLTILIVNIRFHWKLRKQPRCKEVEFIQLLENCKNEMKLRNKITMIYVDTTNTPSITGLIRPKLLLPKEIMHQLSYEEKRYVFLHELAHLKRKDIFINWIALYVQVINWFNPLVWYAFYKMREEAEESCDASVLAHLKKSEHVEYGKTILNFLTKLSKPNLMPVTMGIANNKTTIQRRIMRIAMFKKTSFKKSVATTALTVGMGLVGLTSALAGPQIFNEEIILKQAEELGIETDGKTLEEINVEIEAITDAARATEAEARKMEAEAQALKQAKELDIDTVGKTLNQVMQEVNDALFLKQAKELGIDTAGKTAGQLDEEVRKLQLVKQAEELGIETDGKTLEELTGSH
ncbi:M56 family metallopeptidase [Chengkuizengella sp. SCS-71B]|uniref:M56 family metallopeptidase n=1 Tax=Chengkuizengella sp. SCS-71B TaxID=3115290 RepID=UPI0032C23162